LEVVFILLEFPSPSRRIFIGSHSLPPLWFAVSVLHHGGRRGLGCPLPHGVCTGKKKNREGMRGVHLAVKGGLRLVLDGRRFVRLEVKGGGDPVDIVSWVDAQQRKEVVFLFSLLPYLLIHFRFKFEFASKFESHTIKSK
jgi:hypothetical protein